jgi:hypothetical protein
MVMAYFPKFFHDVYDQMEFKYFEKRIVVGQFILHVYAGWLTEKELCTFCMETKENVLHLFWNCNLVQNV